MRSLCSVTSARPAVEQGGRPARLHRRVVRIAPPYRRLPLLRGGSRRLGSPRARRGWAGRGAWVYRSERRGLSRNTLVLGGLTVAIAVLSGARLAMGVRT